MMRILAFALLFLIALYGHGAASDLYRVTVQSQADADRLTSISVDPIIEVSQGYLVLAEESAFTALDSSGLDIQLIAAGITRDELALDRYPDDRNEMKYDLLFKEGGIRVYRVDPDLTITAGRAPDLFTIGPIQPTIRYVDPEVMIETPDLSGLDVDLNWLISQVNTDSLESYVWTLQTFFDRVAGTLPNAQARDWAVNEFESFGYDSVVVDSFVKILNGGVAYCQNVVAYKIGTRYPNHHVIVGGHRDAVPGSPGADDNGSGAAGVLEIARLLQDIETDLTIVFVLFDAEEWGLYGSIDYVNKAAQREDSIVYMLNMDMIADDNNNNTARVYYGPLTTYTGLWAHLADSLLGLRTVFSGSINYSDHYPFEAAGYDVTCVSEFLLSEYLHDYRDSIQYLNFDYMTKLVKTSLATSFAVSQTVFAKGLTISFPDGVPTIFQPRHPTSFNIQVDGVNGGEPVPGNGRLHYCVDSGAWNSIPLVENSPGQYTATIPGQECLSLIRFYVSFHEVDGGEFFGPDAATPFRARAASSVDVFFEDDFETDKGWIATWISATSGRWERAVPINDTTTDADPPADCDGSGMCYVTGNYRRSDVGEGSVLLWTPHLDMTTGGTIEYAYFLYLNNSGDGVDRMAVQISDFTGEANWIEVASHEISGGDTWRYYQITSADLIAAGVELTYKMRLRFVVNDSDPQSKVEAAIDAFKLITYNCDQVGCCGQYTGGYTGNANSDTEGKRNLADISRLIDRVYLTKIPLVCEENGNVDADWENKINLADITELIDHVFISKEEVAPCP